MQTTNDFHPIIADLEALIAAHPAMAQKLQDIKTRITNLVGGFANEMKDVRNIAEVDDLTKLGNRRGWEAKCREYTSRDDVAVMFLDLNGLKTVNDEQGHDAGDDLIRRAADCIRTSIRGNDYAARIGGDEFVILLTNFPASKDALTNSLDRVRSNFNNDAIKVSIGAVARNETTSFAAMVALADSRMYQDKRSQKSLKV